MPQFDFTTYSSQIFWFLLCFLALYLAMHFIIVPRIQNIISKRKNVIDYDILSAQKLDDQITELRNKSDLLRKEAAQKYQVQIEEVSRKAMREREKSMEELKEKIDEITKKSRQELKSFMDNSRDSSELAMKNLLQVIKTKILN